jgi:hypothetical protein
MVLMTYIRLRTGGNMAFVSERFNLPTDKCYGMCKAVHATLAAIFRHEKLLDMSFSFKLPRLELGSALKFMFIGDCTEIRMQSPWVTQDSRCCWSEYYKDHTVKIFVVLNHRLELCFLSSGYLTGTASDSAVVAESKFYEFMKKHPGLILFDKGFGGCAKGVAQANCEMMTPSYLSTAVGQLTNRQKSDSQELSRVRVHIERQIRRMKMFSFLSGRFPIKMQSQFDDILASITLATMFMPPLVKKK